jgi:hypothetical protein
VLYARRYYFAAQSFSIESFRLQKLCYLRRVDHDKKIRSREQRRDIGKYSFVNTTIQLWNQSPADTLETVSCKPSNFKKGLLLLLLLLLLWRVGWFTPLTRWVFVRMIGFISVSYMRTFNYIQVQAVLALSFIYINLPTTVAHTLGFSVSTSRLLATDLNTDAITSNH